MVPLANSMSYLGSQADKKEIKKWQFYELGRRFVSHVRMLTLLLQTTSGRPTTILYAMSKTLVLVSLVQKRFLARRTSASFASRVPSGCRWRTLPFRSPCR